MAQDSTSNFEIPSEMRSFAEKSVAQARQAFEGFIGAAQQAVEQVEGQAARSQAGAKDVRRKAMAFAEHNVASYFDFAQKLARARDVEEVVRLQADFVKAQVQALGEQARELGDTATQVGVEAARRSA